MNNKGVASVSYYAKRITAAVIDFGIIGCYLGILFWASVHLNEIYPLHQQMEESYVVRHLISFFTVTLPVLLYFIIMEQSKYRGTTGKLLFRLNVVDLKNEKAPAGRLVVRNIIKFLPWELAHTVIHLNPGFITSGEEISIWLTIGLLLPQVMVFIYVAIIFIRRDKRSLYEILSSTKVSLNR